MMKYVAIAGLALLTGVLASTSTGHFLKRHQWPPHLVSIDTGGDVGAESSVHLIKNRPAVAYYDTTSTYLKYARASTISGDTPSDWTVEIADNTATTGTAPALAELRNGAPAIVYKSDTSTELKYLVGSPSGSVATSTIVDLVYTDPTPGALGAVTSIVVLANGFPAIAFDDATNGLMFGVSSTVSGSLVADWTFVNVHADVPTHLSLALINGKPAIAYTDGSDTDLKYVISSTADGKIAGDWTQVVVDGTAVTGEYPSLFEVDGKPAISYHNVDTKDLEYAFSSTATGSTAVDWTSITLDTAGDVGVGTSLKVVDDAPAIAYYDATEKNLKYAASATTDGSSVGDWITQVVDFPLHVGLEPTLTVTGDGRPAISYYDSSDADLKYAVPVERSQNPSFLGASGSCPNQCSGHGYCGPQSVCECFYRWMGNDCSQRVCKEGLAWVDGSQENPHSWAECSNKGMCDRESGECVCFPEYTGAACERSTCPNDCSGHGQCEYIHEIGTYDSTEWDYWKIQGCRCDGDWTGVDCSQRICPWGDDPLTVPSSLAGDAYTITVVQNGTHVEAEMFLEIDDLNGVTHRGRPFTYSSSDDGSGAPVTTAEFKAMLLDIPAIQGVTGVTVTDSLPSGVVFEFQLTAPLRLNRLDVQFRDFCTDAGCYPKKIAQVPEDIYDTIITSVDVSIVSADSLAESAECSNRGACDLETGTCVCHEGHYGLACQHQTILV